MLTAIAAAICAGVIVNWIVNGCLRLQGAGTFPGLIAAIWTAWPLLHRHKVNTENFLHPQPKKYQASYQQVFGKIVSFLREANYHFGDKWQFPTPDPDSRRFVADLRFIEDGNPRQRLRRHIKLEVQFNPIDSNETIVQLDFAKDIDGLDYTACDSIISGVQDALDQLLGPGKSVGQPMSIKLSAPPWWLLALTAGMLFGLLLNVLQAVFQ